MISRVDLKRMSREQIRGKIGIIFLSYLVVTLITSAVAFTVVGSVIAACGFALSFHWIFLRVTQWELPELKDIFTGFNVLGKAIGLNLMIAVFTWLWSLLLIVPGVVKALSYSMANFVLAENPHMTAREALFYSKKITKGHLMELFILELSFIPWALLVAVTFGLAYIYVGPYMMAAKANFYRELKHYSVAGVSGPAAENVYAKAMEDVNVDYYRGRGNSN